MPLRFCCVDDSPLCLNALRRRFQSTHHKCIGELDCVLALKPFLDENQCDVVIAELNVKGLDVLEQWHSVRSSHPTLKLLLYCYNENPTHVARAAAIDAWDYVLKRQPMHCLVHSLEAVPTGQRRSESLLAIARRYLRQRHFDSTQVATKLTPREQDVLVHLSLGLSNFEISRSLGISTETVKEHMQNLLKKVQVSDRTAAAIWSIQNGIPPLVLEPTH
jgi:DNA-binding NarL/FixJ family response regulator